MTRDSRGRPPRARLVLAIAIALAACVAVAHGQAGGSPPPLDGAWIRPHVGDDPSSNIRNQPNGESILTNVPIQALILEAYPLQTIPYQIIGLPAWAQASRWDAAARGKESATPEERQGMWRAVLADRMKLKVHYEMRERPSFDLVFARADRTLGPGLQPSKLDCSASPPAPPPGAAPTNPIDIAMARCGLSVGRAGMYSGGTYLPALLVFLQAAVGRTIVDHTGLTGLYAIRLAFTREPPTAGPGELPSVFVAVQEQLGLRLDPSTTQVQVLVVDHIERPAAEP